MSNFAENVLCREFTDDFGRKRAHLIKDLSENIVSTTAQVDETSIERKFTDERTAFAGATPLFKCGLDSFIVQGGAESARNVGGAAGQLHQVSRFTYYPDFACCAHALPTCRRSF